jgi:hypothetical protein
LDEWEVWKRQTTERLEVLRAEVLGLLGADDTDPSRQPQLTEIRRELETLERLWKQMEEAWGSSN